jgi:hypothetical protein
MVWYVLVLQMLSPVAVLGDDSDQGNITSCLDRRSPNYLNCCKEYGISMKPYWLLLLQPVMLALLTDIIPVVLTVVVPACLAECWAICQRSRHKYTPHRHSKSNNTVPPEDYVSYAAPLVQSEHDTEKVTENEMNDETTSCGSSWFKFMACCMNRMPSSLMVGIAIVIVEALMAFVGSYAIIIGRTHGGVEDWDGYSATVMLLMNSGLGSVIFAFTTRAFSVIQPGIAQDDDEPQDGEEPFWGGDNVGRAAENRALVGLAAFICFLLLFIFTGFGIAGFWTHIVPGLVVFIPMLTAAVLLSFFCKEVVLAFMVRCVHTQIASDVEDREPGDMLVLTLTYTLFYTPVAAVVWIITPTLMFQFYDGVSWTDAIVNDANARSTRVFMECVSTQMERGVTSVSDFVLIFV